MDSFMENMIAFVSHYERLRVRRCRANPDSFETQNQDFIMKQFLQGQVGLRKQFLFLQGQVGFVRGRGVS